MPKTKISEFDVNPDNNTDINSINIAEGCAPSGINNAIRQLMSDLKEFQTGAGGDPFNGAVNGTVGATTPASGAFTTLSASGAFSANGGATLGDASGDALTINSSAVSIPNGLNFGSNNLVLSSGNVGIGTSSPSKKLDIVTPSGTYEGLQVTAGGNHPSLARFIGGGGGSVDFGSDSLASTAIIRTAGTERMRIDSSGNLLVGTATYSQGYSGYRMIMHAAAPLLKFQTSGSAWDIYHSGSGNEKFYFAYNSSDKATINQSTGAYTALSDVNKKKDFEDSTIGLDAVMRLQPKLFRMLEDAETEPKQLGFVAQDVKDVIPQAYSETEGGMGGIFIGLQDRPFIAVLTKAIQEQQAIITDLKARLEVLESK